MGAFGWTVVGSVAGVVGAGAAIVFGLLPLLRTRTNTQESPGEAAARRSAANRGSALPGAVMTVGRDDEIRLAVTNVLSRPPVPTVVLGSAGVGKTNLTIALIHNQQVEEAFGNCRFVVRCEGASSGSDLVASVGVAVGATPGPTALVEITARLGETPCLVVLDNADTPWEAATAQTEGLFAQLASIKGLALVASLREGERPGGAPWGPPIRLRPLDAGSARTLFLNVAGQRFAQPGLDDLLGQMGGIPLGIELLAHNAEREDGLDTLVRRWQGEGVRLLQRAGGDTSGLSVYAALEMSWRSKLMTEPARRLLTVLSRLPDGIARDDLVEVLPGEGDAAASTLQARGLAFYEGGRVRTHTLLSNGVRDLHRPEAADWRRAVNYYVRRGRELGVAIGRPGGAMAASYLARDLANVRVTLLDALSAEEPGDALQAAATILDAARFAALDLGELPGAVLAATQRSDNIANAGQALVSLGAFFRERSDTRQAIEYLDQALRLYRQTGDLHGEAICLEWLGSCARDSSDVDVARDLYSQALVLYRQIGDLHGEANCLRGLGHCARVSSEISSARDYYEQAIVLYRQVPDLYGEANCVCRLGDCARDSDELDRASEYYNRALVLYRQIGDLHGEANAFLGQGDCAHLSFKPSLAKEYYRKALDLYHKVGHVRGEQEILRRLRRMDHDNGAGD
jgi:tetratricopeptide (TPR) repeat protein